MQKTFLSKIVTSEASILWLPKMWFYSVSAKKSTLSNSPSVPEIKKKQVRTYLQSPKQARDLLSSSTQLPQSPYLKLLFYRRLQVILVYHDFNRFRPVVLVRLARQWQPALPKSHFRLHTPEAANVFACLTVQVRNYSRINWVVKSKIHLLWTSSPQLQDKRAHVLNFSSPRICGGGVLVTVILICTYII